MARASTRGSEFYEIDSGTAQIRWDGPLATLFIDGVESSCLNTANPADLEFEYMQHATCALDAVYPREKRIRALHLGGAGCALPAAWASQRPSSTHTAVEIDAALASAVREWFTLPRSPKLSIRVGDGRQLLETSRPSSFDVIVRDAFSGGTVPAHMQTLGFAHAALRALKPGGLLLANCAHGGGLDARRDIASLAATFPEVLSIQDPKVGRSQRRGNVLVIASAAPAGHYPIAQLDRMLRTLPLPARAMDAAALQKWLAGATPVEDPADEASADTAPQ